MREQHNAFSGIAGKVFDRACNIVLECDRGKVTLDDALDNVPSDFRRIVEHLLFCFFRYRRPVETILRKFISRPPAPEVMTILAVAAVQCHFQSGIAPQSAVNIAVDAAKKFHADKFVNAVLSALMPCAEPQRGSNTRANENSISLISFIYKYFL